MELKIDIINYIGAAAPPNSASALLPFIHDRQFTRPVVEALYAVRYDKLSDLLVSKLRDENLFQDTQAAIIRMLGRLAPPGAEKIVSSFLQYRDLTVPVLEALSNLSPTYGEGLLISYLSDPNPEIKKTAIRGVGQLRSKKAIPFLIHFLSHPSPEIVREAVDALSAIGDKQALQPLLLALLTAHDFDVIQHALKAVAQLKNRGSIEYLTPFLKHPHEPIQRAATEAIRKLGSNI